MRAPWRSSWVVMVSSKSSPMRTPYSPAARRRILCVYPVYARSFGTFQHAYPFFGGRVRAFMPPQGLLAVAAYLPETWDVRFVDENSRAATDDDSAGPTPSSSPACTCSGRASTT